MVLPGGPASQRQRAQNRGCGHAVKGFCAYNEKQAAWSAQAQRDLGPVGNGDDGIVEDMDPDRIQTVIDKSADAGMDIPAGLSVEDIVTNEFINTSIGFPINLTPGTGVSLTMGRANWASGYIQAEIVKQVLETAGYSVSSPADIELGPSNTYSTMAEGTFDLWANSWYPGHFSWYENELTDDSLVADHVEPMDGLLHIWL